MFVIVAIKSDNTVNTTPTVGNVAVISKYVTVFCDRVIVWVYFIKKLI